MLNLNPRFDFRFQVLRIESSQSIVCQISCVRIKWNPKAGNDCGIDRDAFVEVCFSREDRIFCIF